MSYAAALDTSVHNLNIEVIKDLIQKIQEYFKEMNQSRCSLFLLMRVNSASDQLLKQVEVCAKVDFFTNNYQESALESFFERIESRIEEINQSRCFSRWHQIPAKWQFQRFCKTFEQFKQQFTSIRNHLNSKTFTEEDWNSFKNTPSFIEQMTHEEKKQLEQEFGI